MRMKRVIVCLLVVVQLLIVSCANAERYLYEIKDAREETGAAYQLIPGKVILSERVDGKIHVEGRVVIRNTLPRPVNYGKSGFLVGYSPSTDESVVINQYVARPATVAQDGYSLLTFSEDIEMALHDDWEFWPHFSLSDATSIPEYIGVGDAVLEPYTGSEAIRAYRYLDDLPEGIYQCIILVADAEHRFLWAEDVTLNTELDPKASIGIEDYEVQLFRAYGKEPTYAEITIQRK